jgi:uncharacterized protein (DUF433 family)
VGRAIIKIVVFYGLGGFMNYSDFIELVPGKRSGKPCLKGTRITVYDVLGSLANGMKPEQIIEDFPEVTFEHITACLSYAAQREHHLLAVSAA